MYGKVHTVSRVDLRRRHQYNLSDLQVLRADSGGGGTAATKPGRTYWVWAGFIQPRRVNPRLQRSDRCSSPLLGIARSMWKEASELQLESPKRTLRCTSIVYHEKHFRPARFLRREALFGKPYTQSYTDAQTASRLGTSPTKVCGHRSPLGPPPESAGHAGHAAK
jgi:hypothetical protein